MRRIVITGPTASGKGALAVSLARRLRGEIVSVDSMKIYRGMDIGTAKPSRELRAEIPHHLVDLLDPWEDFSVGEFIRRVCDTVRAIESRGGVVILQGGTAFYLHALVNGLFEGPPADWDLRGQLTVEAEERGLAGLHEELGRLDPEVATKIHPHDRKRIFRALEVIRKTGRKLSELWQESPVRLEEGTYECFGISHDRSALYERINRRVEMMVSQGLFEEVGALLAGPHGLSRTASKCIGYRQIIEDRESGESREETVARIQRDTRRFAKQQLTWFRRFSIVWLEAGDPEALGSEISKRSR